VQNFSVGTGIAKMCKNSSYVQWWKQNNQCKKCSELVFVDSLVLQKLVLHTHKLQLQELKASTPAAVTAPSLSSCQQ
jgi:hypothetical protein